MNDMFEIIGDINWRVDKWVKDNTKEIRVDEIGLPSQCGYVNICEDGIVVRTINRSFLDWYAKFEYVEPCYIETIGDWTFYSAESEKVATVLNKTLL